MSEHNRWCGCHDKRGLCDCHGITDGVAVMIKGGCVTVKAYLKNGEIMKDMLMMETPYSNNMMKKMNMFELGRNLVTQATRTTTSVTMVTITV